MTRRSLVKHLERFLLYPIISRLSFFLILRYGGVTHRQAVGGNGRTRFFSFLLSHVNDDDGWQTWENVNTKCISSGGASWENLALLTEVPTCSPFSPFELSSAWQPSIRNGPSCVCVCCFINSSSFLDRTRSRLASSSCSRPKWFMKEHSGAGKRLRCCGRQDGQMAVDYGRPKKGETAAATHKRGDCLLNDATGEREERKKKKKKISLGGWEKAQGSPGRAEKQKKQQSTVPGVRLLVTRCWPPELPTCLPHFLPILQTSWEKSWKSYSNLSSYICLL